MKVPRVGWRLWATTVLYCLFYVPSEKSFGVGVPLPVSQEILAIASEEGNPLYRIDPVSGVSTKIGNTLFGGTLQSLTTSPEGTIYSWDLEVGLVTINPQSGQVVDVNLGLSHLEDVSGDGLLDLTLKFSTADLVEYGALGPDTLEGLLTGTLLDGTSFSGTDSIRIVPPNGNSLQVNTVPEPSALALTTLGLLGIGWRRRERAGFRCSFPR